MLFLETKAKFGVVRCCAQNHDFVCLHVWSPKKPNIVPPVAFRFFSKQLMQTLQEMCATHLTIRQSARVFETTAGMLPERVLDILQIRCARVIQAIVRRRVFPKMRSWMLECRESMLTASFLKSKFVEREMFEYVLGTARLWASLNLKQLEGRGNCLWIPSWVCQCLFGDGALSQLDSVKMSLRGRGKNTISFCIENGIVIHVFETDVQQNVTACTDAKRGHCFNIYADLKMLLASVCVSVTTEEMAERARFARGTIGVDEDGRVYVYLRS